VREGTDRTKVLTEKKYGIAQQLLVNNQTVRPLRPHLNLKDSDAERRGQSAAVIAGCHGLSECPGEEEDAERTEGSKPLRLPRLGSAVTVGGPARRRPRGASIPSSSNDTTRSLTEDDREVKGSD
jgi:hypothetical protein